MEGWKFITSRNKRQSKKITQCSFYFTLEREVYFDSFFSMKFLILSIFYFSTWFAILFAEPESKDLFGDKFPKLDHLSTGEWWNRARPPEVPSKKGKPPKRIIELKVPRDQVVAFALYTQDAGTLTLTGQLYPLMPEETREVRLETKLDDKWKEISRVNITYPGWSAHFRIKNWDSTKDIPYRVRHGEKAFFEGLIRKDPIDQETIVVGNLSCNSSRTKGPRPQIIENLKLINPDMLFFAGDQTYHHTEHTAGWIEFGLQFRDLMKDRPM